MINPGEILSWFTTNADSMGSIIATLFVCGIAYYFWNKREEQKSWNINVTVYAQRGHAQVIQDDVAKQFKNDKGVIRFISKKYEIDLPSLDYRYFILEESTGKRSITFYNPIPGVYIPVLNHMLMMKDKQIRLVEKSHCDICKIAKNKNYKIPEEREYEKDNGYVFCCEKHMNNFIISKFKIVAEASKDWYLSRIKERMERAQEPKFWDKPIAQLITMGIIWIVFVYMNYRYGNAFIEESVKTAITEGTAQAIQMWEGAMSNFRP